MCKDTPNKNIFAGWSLLREPCLKFLVQSSACILQMRWLRAGEGTRFWRLHRIWEVEPETRSQVASPCIKTAHCSCTTAARELFLLSPPESLVLTHTSRSSLCPSSARTSAWPPQLLHLVQTPKSVLPKHLGISFMTFTLPTHCLCYYLLKFFFKLTPLKKNKPQTHYFKRRLGISTIDRISLCHKEKVIDTLNTVKTSQSMLLHSNKAQFGKGSKPEACSLFKKELSKNICTQWPEIPHWDIPSQNKTIKRHAQEYSWQPYS